MAKPGEQTPSVDSFPTSASAVPTWREILHQLNNVFASIHSSIDLALVNEGRQEAKGFMESAQVAARRGAALVGELRANLAPGAGSGPLKTGSPSSPVGATETVSDPKVLEGSESILVAEDDEALRMLLQAILGYRGYRVSLAEDGEQAVRVYQEHGPFDLVILDLRMPRLDGHGALERIRALNPSACALALTGMPLGPDQESTFKGFNGQMTKPFHSVELVTQVRRLLDRSKSA